MTRKQFIRLDINDLVVGGGRPKNPPRNNDEFTYVESEADLESMLLDDNYFVWDGQGFVNTGHPKSSLAHNVWSKDQRKWVDGREIDQKKSDKWNEIKDKRSGEEFGSFDWGDYTFDCDEVSQRRIQGVVQLAAIDSTMTLDWTLADNSVVSFGSAEYILVGQALAIHVDGCHAKARLLRVQIDAATTEEELNAINW